MRLGRWTGPAEEFTPVLHCFEPLKGDRSRLINVRLKREWDQAHATVKALSEAGKRGAQIKQQLHAAKPHRTKRITTPTPPHADWMTTIKADPLYAHVNFTREDAKMDAWIADHPGRVKNRAFVRTWLNKIEPPLSHGPLTLTCPHHPTLTFPDAQAKKVHDFSYHPKYVG